MSTRIPTRNKAGFSEMEQLRQEMGKLLEEAKAHTKKGKVVDYIPELKRMDSHLLGMTVVSTGGKEITAGDVHVRFTLQSISKVFALTLAIMDRGMDEVFRHVGMEPSAEPFDSFPPSLFLPINKPEFREWVKPANPMINSGAIVVSSLIKGQNAQEKLERLLRLVRVISGNPTIRINQHVYASEKQANARNWAIAYLLREQGFLKENVEEVLDLYFMQCAIEASCRDLAYMATCLANGGTVWGLSKPVIPREIVRVLTALMVTCGMYHASGQFAARVGIPAKSGVSGGIMAFVPGKYGVGIIGPAIDEKGNSVAGTHLLASCVNRWGWSLF